MGTAAIVVGTDGSPSACRAVERAGELAAALEATVHVVMSCETVSTAALIGSAAGAFGPMLSIDEGAEKAAQDVVQAARRDLGGRGVASQAHVCSGDPADALLAVAEDVGAEMIVVGNRGMSGPRRMLGSVPNRVSHRARCAVLIVPTC
jgi:nucleotide-binding universal stress UspA family protein